MLYAAAFTETLAQSNMARYIEALKLLITGDITNFLEQTIVSSRYSFPPNNEYPKSRRYFFVGQVNDLLPTDNNSPGDVSIWFKKEHPLYAGHFMYVGLRFVRNYYQGSNLTPWVISVDAAENYKDGMLINRVKGFNPAENYGTKQSNGTDYSSYWSNSESNTGYYGYTIRGGAYPVISAASPDYGNSAASANLTFLLSDWGFGVFGGGNRKATSNSVSNLLGVLFLETLASNLNSTNENAFIPKNYPMFALLESSAVGSNNWTMAQYGIITNINRYVTLLRAPGEDSALKSLANYVLSSLAYNINNGNTLDADHVYRNADGEECAEMYPVFVRARNTLLAKLPLMKPIVGSHRYVHMNKRLEVGDKVYHGIISTHLGIAVFSPELSNDGYVALRTKGLNHEYIRLK